MAQTRKCVPGTIVRFEKMEGRHYPFVRFVTKDGQQVEHVWTGRSLEDKGAYTDAAALAKLNGLVVQVEYDTANPAYFDLADNESPSLFAAAQTSMNFSVTPKSKKHYLFPYTLILGFLVLFIVSGCAGFLLVNNDTRAANEALNLFARILFFALYALLPAALLYYVQHFYTGSERVMVKDDVIYHYRCRNMKNMLAEHRYSRILHVDLVIAGRQRIRVYGEIEQVVNIASRRKKTYYRQSFTSPDRKGHDEVPAYQQSESAVPDSDKLIVRTLNDPTNIKRKVKVSRLDIRRTMENAEFLTEKLRAVRGGQSAGGIGHNPFAGQ